jgi:glycosyltransferase involved in cell wall biosynthesis
VLALDTCWTGSLKQRIFSWCSKVYLQRVFSHVWIPGLPQQSYAERLGFHDNQILQNLYSADVERFQIFFDEFREEKRAVFPKRFLYVGRYAKEKGLQTLCDAFYRFSKQNVEWELHCLGTGPLTSKGFEHSRIRHFGFVQPSELKAHFQASGIYVMPSHFEPWGVSLHEAVAAGMPAIVSDRVGSASAFVESGKNGYLYPSRDEAELERCLHRMAELDHGELERMSVRSNELAQKITPTDWANELLVLIA